MDKEKFIKIMDHCDIKFDSSQGAYKGLILMAEYINDINIDAAVHDKIYASCEVDDLLEAGITEEHAVILSGLGWSIDDEDYIAMYV
jgi:hypothetical protein